MRSVNLFRRTQLSAMRGVTLIEIMVVIVIIGIIAGGVAMGVLPQLKKGQVSTTETSARTLRQVAEQWRALKGGDMCPTPQLLLQEKALDSASGLADAWGTTFKIICEEDETIVTSPGPDKREGTADDIRIPALAAKTN